MKFILFAVTFFTSSFLLGQNPLKKYPLKSTYEIFHERTMIFNSKFNESESIKKALVDTKVFTQTQLDIALKYAQVSEYPEALNSYEKLMNINGSERVKYKTYWIGSWTEFFPKLNSFRQLHLVWVPKEDNLSLSKGYLPKTDDGFYIITRSVDADNLPFITMPEPTINKVVEKLESKKIQKAEKITDLYNNVMPGYGHAMGGFYTTLKNTYNLTDDEIEIISRSNAIDCWPDSLKFSKRKDLSFEKINDYNYYKLGEYVGESGVNELFWVPAKQTFVEGFQPKSNLGFFFTARINETKKIYINEKEDLAYVNSPWWFKNVSSTESYNNTTLILGNSSGVTAATTSSGNKSGGFTTTTVNGVTVATANLERKNKRSGVMILYFGSNRIVSNVSLFVVEIDKNNSEDGIAESLQRRVAGSSPYMYFEFKEGFDCSNAQGYLRKKGISPPSCTY